MHRTAIRLVVIAILLFAIGIQIGRAEAVARVPLQVIQGEAGTCSIEAKYAVANLWHRNSTMYGWSDRIDMDTYRVWRTYRAQPEQHPEAHFIWSSEDLRDTRVIQVIMELDRPPRAIFHCSGGSALFLY